MKNIKNLSLLICSLLFAGLNMVSAQTPAQNKETSQKLIAAFDTGDVNTFALYVSPNLMEHMPPPSNMPKASSDFEMDKLIVAKYHEAFPDAHSDIRHIVAEGDLVTAHSLYSATNKGELMGMPATNKPVKIEQVDIFRFDPAGRCIEHWAVIDHLAMLQQLGLIPTDDK